MGRKGIPLSAEHRAAISAGVRLACTPRVRAKISKAGKGKKKPPGFGAKISAAKLGVQRKPFSAEWRANLGKACRNRPGSNLGKTFSAEWKANIATSVKKSMTPERLKRMSLVEMGKNNHQWRGGLSILPYSWSFNKELKEEVRRRDEYKCQLCGAPQEECYRALDVHHVDYDKQNSDPVNLVALCQPCHCRTHTNRPHWTTFFQNAAFSGV